MLRSLCAAARNVATHSLKSNNLQNVRVLQSKFQYSHLALATQSLLFKSPNVITNSIVKSVTALRPNIAVAQPLLVPNRTVTKFSMKKGKRKSVATVLRRFYRLNWGAWIRTKAGRHSKMWKRSIANKIKKRQHVFCNATQCNMLDKMVTMFWKRPKHYVDDIYAPYHTREEFYKTRKRPTRRD